MTVAMQSLEEQAPLIPQNDLMTSELESKGALLKRPADQIRIVVTEHPSSTFYKDEGGKSNHMTAGAAVQLAGVKASRKQSLPNGSLTLKPKLVYESGADVEDADDVSSLRNAIVVTYDDSCSVDFQGAVHRAKICIYNWPSCDR